MRECRLDYSGVPSVDKIDGQCYSSWSASDDCHRNRRARNVVLCDVINLLLLWFKDVTD